MFAILLLLFAQQITTPASESGSISGTLRTATGAPATSIRVTAMVPPDTPQDVFFATSMSSIAETDASGRFRLENVLPGRYYISAGTLARPTYYPGTLDLARGRVVTVTAKQAVLGIDFVVDVNSSGRAIGLTQPTFPIPLEIQTEGGGKVPKFQNGNYPLIKLTDVRNNAPFEFTFDGPTLMLPISQSNTAEYRVLVEGLQDGYAVKTMTYGVVDVSKETLLVTAPPILTLNNGLTSTVRTVMPGAPEKLRITLTKTGGVSPRKGAVVSGTSPAVGDEIYISDVPGVLNTDGSFEFRDVPPGRHIIVKYKGDAITTAIVEIGDSDLNGVTLQRPSLLPVDYSAGPSTMASAPAQSKQFPPLSLHLQILDETGKEPVHGGTVTLAGYRSTRAIIAIVGDGNVVAHDLLPGTYTLTLNVSGYKPSTQSITVGAENSKLVVLGQRDPDAKVP